MRTLTRRQTMAAAAATGALIPRLVQAETSKLRVSHGYSIGYLPLMVMREHGLIEKHAAAAGLGPLTVEWQVIDGGNNINDGMLAGLLDIAGIGIPGYLVLRDRTLGKRQEMTAISALQAGALWLNTIDPRIKTLADYTPTDRIAVPGIKTSYAAVVLEMMAAKAFGIDNYAKLDPITVGIKSHMASPPFSYQELKNPAVHRVQSSSEAIGPLTILVTMTQRLFADANPGVVNAFLAAQQDAVAFIAADRPGAAATYSKGTGLKTPQDELIAILDDPENSYSLAPNGSLTYAAFRARTGVLKAKPSSWTEMFLPAIHGLSGS